MIIFWFLAVEEHLVDEDDKDVYTLSKLGDSLNLLFSTQKEDFLPIFDQLLPFTTKLLVWKSDIDISYIQVNLCQKVIFASTNPQYDNRMFIELQIQYLHENYKHKSRLEHVAYTNCFLFWHSEQFVYTTCSELGFFLYWTCNSMINQLSYCGLVNARINASKKDLPVSTV